MIDETLLAIAWFLISLYLCNLLPKLSSCAHPGRVRLYEVSTVLRYFIAFLKAKSRRVFIQILAIVLLVLAGLTPLIFKTSLMVAQ